MKKNKNKEVEDNLLTDLNDFMKKFGIEEITFGKSHSIKKTDNKKAKSLR